MKRWNTVAIVGVGLIGGSVGLALRQRRLAEHVIGIGRRASSLRSAKRAGAVTRTTIDLSRGVADAELVVVCTPVAHIAQHVRQAAAACVNAALITDAGSTKVEIVRQLDGSLPGSAPFVGSHPLAGSEKSGSAHASGDLFKGRVVVVTPTRRTPKAALDVATEFWSSLGATVAPMSPASHDRALAATSHVPHVVASALVSSVREADFPLASTGLRSTTRIAASDSELWAQILLSNSTQALKSLDRFDQSLSALRKAIRQNDTPQLVKLLGQAKRKRDALGN